MIITFSFLSLLMSHVSINMSLQLKIRDLEQRLKTPDKFQFPFFELTHWYSAPAVLRLLEDNLKEKKVPPPHLLDGVRSLVSALKLWLNRSVQSKDDNHQENYNNGGGEDDKSKRGGKKMLMGPDGGTSGNTCLAPQGINCRKIIKDLNRALKTGDKKRRDDEETQHKTKKTVAKLQTGVKRSSTDSTHAKFNDARGVTPSSLTSSTGIRSTHLFNATDDDSSEQLVVDEQPSPHPTSIRIKLSKCEKSVYQVTGAPILPSPVKHQKDEAPEEDPEILEMIKNRPEDDEYIYLDVETGMDEEDGIGSSTRGRDEAWTPRAKVVIRGTPKGARPSRDNARREVVETCIANAAAKLEHVDHVKRHYVRRKQHSTTSRQTAVAPEMTASPSLHQSQPSASGSAAPHLMLPSADSSSTGDGDPDAGFSTGVNASSSSSSTGIRNKNQPQSQPKPKKGLKTAKQRLAKVMKINRRF